MSPFYITQNDTKPLTAQLLEADGDPDSLSGCTVTFTMVGPGNDTTKVVNAQAVTVTTAATALVSYPFTALQTADAGAYKGTFRVLRGDGTYRTYPDPGYIPIVITGALGDT